MYADLFLQLCQLQIRLAVFQIRLAALVSLQREKLLPNTLNKFGSALCSPGAEQNLSRHSANGSQLALKAQWNTILHKTGSDKFLDTFGGYAKFI